MRVKPAANKNNKGQQGLSKYVTSESCMACTVKCRRGIRFLTSLSTKGKANCPLCPVKENA